MKKFILSAFADEAGSAVSEQIKALQENGMTHLEVRGVNGKNIVDLTLEEAKELKKELDDGGISVWAIGSPLGKISVGDEFAPHLDKMKHTLELADILGTTHIRMFSFFCPKGEADLCRELVFDRLGKFCDAAKGSGILLCHENEKGIYGESAECCMDIQKEFDGRIKLIFDPANFVMDGHESYPAAYNLLGDKIYYMHIKDATADKVICPAGKGIGGVPQILADLDKKRDGKIFLSVEPHLKVFKGFDALEATGDKTIMPENTYSSNTEAFGVAVKALKDIIGK